MTRYDEETCSRLLAIAQNHRNCVDEYEEIVSSCPQKVMSKGIDLYGCFLPDMEISKYFDYKGKLTTNEKRKHFSYYFDEKGRLRLTERYGDQEKLLNLIFYYYYEHHIEIVWYDVNRKEVCITGFIDYNAGRLSKFVESYDIVQPLQSGKPIKSYHEYLFDAEQENVIHRVYSADMFSDGREWETISKIRKR